jgi:hypothetical protein
MYNKMEVLKLKTFVENPLLSDEQIDIYNASNSIIISQSLFQEITDKDAKGNVITIGLYYNSKKIYVGITDTHVYEPHIIYIPLWIYKYFDYKDDDLVNYMQVFPKMGNRIKIKPIGDFYSYLDDPVTALRDGFEKYSCLLENTRIVINVQSIPLEIDILETYINSEKNNKNQPICIRGVELEVDILEEPKLESEPEPKKPIYQPNLESDIESVDFSTLIPLPKENKFPGKGHSFKK